MESISAADLEKFCYCPLSWQLAREGEVRSPALDRGRDDHRALAGELGGIVRHEGQAGRFERWAVGAALLAPGLAVVGALLFSAPDPLLQGRALSALALLWMFLACAILYRSARHPDRRLARGREVGMGAFALLGVVAALNAVPVFSVEQEQGLLYVALSIALLLSAVLALCLSSLLSRRAREARGRTEVSGEIVYIGEGDGPGPVLRSAIGLTGRPDYVLELDEGLVPVEVKTGRTPRGPLFSHVLQLAAYCYLVEENRGKVAYGIVRYAEGEHHIEYDDQLRTLLLAKVKAMRRHLAGAPVHRDHAREGKCRSCSRRAQCPERLV